MTSKNVNLLLNQIILMVQMAIDALPQQAESKMSAGSEPRKLKKPKNWCVDSNGKVPGWVKTTTGLDSRRSIAIMFGPEAKFVEGEPLPAKL